MIPEGSSLSNHHKAIDLNAKRDKLKPEITGNNKDHYQNLGAQLDADWNISQASRPATSEEEHQTAASWRDEEEANKLLCSCSTKKNPRINS